MVIAAASASLQTQVGRPFVARHVRRNGQIVPLWAESGQWGPQRHPSTTGKPWSVRRLRRVSGCRIRCHAFSANLSRRKQSRMSFACTSICICLQLRSPRPTFFDTWRRAFLLHSLSPVGCVPGVACLVLLPCPAFCCALRRVFLMRVACAMQVIPLLLRCPNRS